VDPGESVVLPVTITNNGTGSVTGISAVLSTSTPGVTVTSNTAAYTDLGPDGTATGSPSFAFTVDDDVPCLTNINFQIAMHANEGNWNDSFSTPIGSTTLPITTYNSTDVPKVIADNATVNSVTNVADTYPITDVDVGVSITHSYDGDVIISLIPPGGAPLVLVNRRGVGGDNFTNTVFDDSAAGSITSGTPPYTGSFRPETALTGLNGTSSNGTWTLRVSDNANLDTGTLTAWFVRLSTTPLPNCTACSLGTPGEAGVGNLHWQLPSSKTIIEWGAASNASFYKVYQGTGSSLPNLLNGSNDSCLKGTTPNLSMGGLSSSPPAGTTWWYLVTGGNGHAEGPAGNATAGPEVINSSGGCP
jgi:subtilisin-like proprotein convertase family protein